MLSTAGAVKIEKQSAADAVVGSKGSLIRPTYSVSFEGYTGGYAMTAAKNSSSRPRRPGSAMLNFVAASALYGPSRNPVRRAADRESAAMAVLKQACVDDLVASSFSSRTIKPQKKTLNA
jgi:hypothetical protein